MTQPSPPGAEYVSKYSAELAIDAVKIGMLLGVDPHELISKTADTIWTCWDAQFDGNDPVAWPKIATKIMFNHGLNLRRSCQRRAKHEQTGRYDDICHELEERLGDWADPAQAILYREQEFEIYTAIRELKNEKYSNAVALAALGFTRPEAAAHLEIPETTYHNHLMRGRKLLRERLVDGNEQVVGEKGRTP